MTIEEMTTMSHVLLVVAVVLGIVAVVLFFTWKIPKAFQVVKGHGKGRKRRVGKKKYLAAQNGRKKGKSNSSTVKLEKGWQQEDVEDRTEVFCEDEVHFTMLQDITFVHVKEELSY